MESNLPVTGLTLTLLSLFNTETGIGIKAPACGMIISSSKITLLPSNNFTFAVTVITEYKSMLFFSFATSELMTG